MKCSPLLAPIPLDTWKSEIQLSSGIIIMLFLLSYEIHIMLNKSICIGNSMICIDIWQINTTPSDISKLFYVISRAIRQVKFETILKYHEWYLCQISRTNYAIIILLSLHMFIPLGVMLQTFSFLKSIQNLPRKEHFILEHRLSITCHRI